MFGVDVLMANLVVLIFKSNKDLKDLKSNSAGVVELIVVDIPADHVADSFPGFFPLICDSWAVSPRCSRPAGHIFFTFLGVIISIFLRVLPSKVSGSTSADSDLGLTGDFHKKVNSLFIYTVSSQKLTWFG